jgi:TetR/AcrR family transcriptional regulator, cholesterol catabolism regulator
MPASPRKQPRRRRDPTPVEKPAGTVEVLHPPRRKRRDQEVIDAAAKVFYERGYADASVQDVADELGILKGSLYHYIETKEDLLFRLLEELHDDVQAILEEVAAEEGLEPLERLALYVRKQVLFDVENLPRVAVYYNDYQRLSPERRAQIVARRRVHERYVTELIEQAQRAGDANSELDARLLSNFIHGAFIWTYRWYRPGGKISREKVADTCAAFVLDGVRGTIPAKRRR